MLARYRLTDLPVLIGLLASYGLAVLLSAWLLEGHIPANFLWLTSGLALVLVLQQGYRYAPAILLGALLGHLLAGGTPGGALADALRHVVVTCLCVWLIKADGSFDPTLSSLGNYLRLLLLAVVYTLTSALLSAGNPDFWQEWGGQALGIVLLMPLWLVWQRLPREWLQPPAAVEAALVLGLAFLAGQIVFLGWFGTYLGGIARGYWMFLLITWAAVRLGLHGTVLILAMTGLQGLIGARLGSGFFADDVPMHLVNYFFFMMSLSLIGMALTTLFRERKESEARVAEALLVAKAANQAKSEFLAHMSHEIRTPVNAIVGAAQLMDHEKLNRRQRGYTAIMQHSSQSLLALIDDILDLSKIEAGCLDFTTEAFDFAQVVDRVRGIATVLTQNKDIVLKFDLEPDLPARLIGDPLRLEQVLNNLFSNAIKFTEHGTIALRVRQVAADAKTVRLLFVLTDTGIGIPRDKLHSIFEPFTQADRFITRTHGGTGLGLAISRQLVAMMGGRIDVESAPAQGSRFSFTANFPLPPAAENALAPDLSTDHDAADSDAWRTRLAGCRVLMVEDNEFNRNVLEGTLKRFGIEVDAAVDGDDGIECFKVGNPYDAILMDLHLPRCDGFSCTRAIRALPEGAQVPIIALTANVLTTTGAECFAAGMNEYLVKPVAPEVLERTLIHWILGQPNSNPARSAVSAKSADALPDALPGIEVAKAAAWCLDSSRGLDELLARMLAHTRDDPATLAQHLAAGNSEAAAQITHDLMAAAATVGASPLGAAAKILNREIRDGRLDSPSAQDALARIGAEFAQLQASHEILRRQVLATDADDKPVEA